MTILKVAWDNCFARRNAGGTGVYAARLLEQFAGRPDLRIEVLNGWGIHSQQGSVATRALRAAGDLFWTHAYLPALLRKKGFDLLHAPAFIAPAVSSCPVVITIHDVTYLLYPEHFSGWWSAYLKLVMPPAVKSAAAIICGSEHSKYDIVKAYGCEADKVHVVPYGVDHRRFYPGAGLDRRWAQALGIRDGYVLHVGTLSHRKNIPTLLRTFAHLRSRENWGKRQLVLAGSEVRGLTGASEIFETIRLLNLTESVVLTGHVPDEHIPGLYSHAGVVVLPSLYEGFGFPILESMAAGTLVVASNTSSLPEVAGDAAILVPPGDEHAFAKAIADAVENRSIAQELRRKGLARAQQFTWQRNAEQTIEIYRDIAKS